jgi:hypothetical protein
MTVSGGDERIHNVEDPSEHWSDSLYFNLWDPASDVFLLTRIAVLPNKPGATAGVLVWRGEHPVYGYGRNLEEVPLADWDDMQVVGLRYRMERALQRWDLELEDGGNGFDLTWDGFTGVVDYADNSQPLPKPVAWGHYEQTCRVTGRLVLNDETIRIDGVGQRDHSWGFRDWGGVRRWHWVTGFFDTHRSFNLFHVEQSDGTVTANGFVHEGGADHLITGVERSTQEADGGAPASTTLSIEVVGGHRCEITAEAAKTAVPVRPAGPDAATVVHEVPMRMSTSDGLEGFGIYELLQN